MSDLSQEGFTGSHLFNFMRDTVEGDENLKQRSINNVKSVVVITLKNKKNERQSWVMDFKTKGTVYKAEGRPPRNDITLILTDDTFVKFFDNKYTAEKLLASGKLKVKGNLMKASSIERFLRSVDPRPRAKL